MATPQFKLRELSEGSNFNFRAREEAWAFSVSDSEDVNPIDIQIPCQGCLREREYGRPKSFEASYISYDDAEAIIVRCAKEYVEARRAGAG